jgi:hypothetical protein
MEEKIVPFQTSKGVVVIGLFISESDPDLYYWIRRFDSEEARSQIYFAKPPPPKRGVVDFCYSFFNSYELRNKGMISATPLLGG